MGGGMAPPVPPSPELLRFKPFMFVIGLLYMLVVILGFASGGINSALNDLFVAIAALLMAFRANECMGQCTLPFLLFAAMALFFDIFGIISTISQPYPGASNFLSSSCPRARDFTLKGNQTVYLNDGAQAPVPGCAAKYTLTTGAVVEILTDQCKDSQWVLQNGTSLCSVFLDILATYLGYQMFKTAGPGGGFGGGGPLMGGQGGDDMGGGMGGPPGGGFGGGGGQRLGGQEMGQAGEGQGRQQGFTPYSGVGQALGS